MAGNLPLASTSQGGKGPLDFLESLPSRPGPGHLASWNSLPVLGSGPGAVRMRLLKPVESFLFSCRTCDNIWVHVEFAWRRVVFFFFVVVVI